MVKQDGVFLTITGTVNESAKVGDVSDFKIQPIDRETTPGSGTCLLYTSDAADE